MDGMVPGLVVAGAKLMEMEEGFMKHASLMFAIADSHINSIFN